MPKFSERSKDKLAECHEDLQILFNEVIKYFDCTVLCGHRNKEDQNTAYSQGYSKVQYPNSKHNLIPSMAVDVVPYPIDWRDTDRMKFFIGFVLGTAQQLRNNGLICSTIVSGIDWNNNTELKDTNFFDHPHYQIKQ